MAITRAFAVAVQDAASGTTLTTGTFNSTGYTHIAMFCKHEGATATSTPTDNKSSTGWASLTKQGNSVSDSWGQFHWVKIGTPGTGHTVTQTLDAARPYRTIIVWLINATSSEIAVDASGTGSPGTPGTPSAGTLVTTAATVSLMGVAEYSGVTYTPGSGWTEDFDAGGTPNYTYGQSRADASSGSIVANCTCSDQDWAACAVSFKESAGGGGSSILRQMMAHHGG